MVDMYRFICSKSPANEIVLACTNRSTTLIPYYNGNGDLTGECKLRGRYIGQANNSVTVNGTWNP